MMKLPEHLVQSTKMVVSLDTRVYMMDMYIIDMDIIDQLIRHYEKDKRWGAEGESQLIDKFLTDNAHKKQFPPKARRLMEVVLGINKFPPLKPLQLLRVLTRSKQLLPLLPNNLLHLLNEHLSQTVNIPIFMTQSLAIHGRYIELDHNMITDDMLGRVLDILAISNHTEVLKMVIEITKEMVNRKRTKVLEEIWYIGRMLFVLDRLDQTVKVKMISLITSLLDCPNFNQNFRRIHGVSTLISELKKSQQNILLKVSILNAIQKLLQQNQVIYDFKTHGIIPLLQQYLELSSCFAQVCLIVNIFNRLIFDDDLNLKFIERGLSYIIHLLVKTHPANRHLLKFQDIEQSKQNQAISELSLLLFRLLRFLFSIEKNRKIFKMIFPSELLGPFIDVGNFTRSISKYKDLEDTYSKLSAEDVENILEKYELNQKDIVSDKQVHKAGSYVLVESVGKGAFGTVYLAKKGENMYALKKVTLNDGQDTARDTMKEVKIYEQLKHPNIVSYYESFVEDQCLCIVMEFIQGFSLSELLKIQNQKSTPFQQKQIWKVVISLLSVLKYLHVDKKILHLDLNPSNIMIDNNFNVKIADFGLAKSITQSHLVASAFQGTLFYSSPQIVSRKPFSHKADIWSFGCVIYELMMLRPPYQGNNTLMVAKTIVDETYDPIPQNLYSDELRNMVSLSLQKDQSKRPDALKLMTLIVDKIVYYADSLRQKQISLNSEITHLTKRLNKKQPLANGSVQQAMRQTQLVKIDTHNLNKIGEDPLVKFLDSVRKLSFINGCQTSFKNNFKKFVIDLFYNKVIINHDIEPSAMKTELSKLINLSKDEVELLKVKYDKKDHKHSITYEMLYFYMEELYQLLRKG